MSVKNGGPAFPPQDRAFVIDGNIPVDQLRSRLSALERDREKGMTLRDYFAGQALSGIFSSDAGTDLEDSVAARRCYEMAEAMLKARAE